VVCGPSGTGKTSLLEALGQQAIETGLKVAWFTLEDLGVLLRRHRADDTVTKAIARVLPADLVVVDDIGLLPVAQDAAEGLYRLVDAAYEKRSVAVSSNLHPAKAHMFGRTRARCRRNITGSAGGQRRRDRRGRSGWLADPCRTRQRRVSGRGC
jgi:DNA replication protein DnaC